MTHPELHDPSVHAEGLTGSYSFFAMLVVSVFVIAIGLAVIGLVIAPSWMGFD
jgi:hypothetical protein